MNTIASTITSARQQAAHRPFGACDRLNALRHERDELQAKLAAQAGGGKS